MATAKNEWEAEAIDAGWAKDTNGSWYNEGLYDDSKTAAEAGGKVYRNAEDVATHEGLSVMPVFDRRGPIQLSIPNGHAASIIQKALERAAARTSRPHEAELLNEAREAIGNAIDALPREATTGPAGNIGANSKTQADKSVAMNITHRSIGIVVNAPGIFARPDFIAWLEDPRNTTFSWHRPGKEPGEHSDIMVLVDSNYEGSDSDMPEDIWHTICDLAYATYCEGQDTLPRLLESPITVRLTNLSQ
jgi:hypothetical protein